MIIEEKVLSKEMQKIQDLLKVNIKESIEKSKPVDMFKTTKMMFAPQFVGDEQVGKKNEYGFDEAQLEEMEQEEELSVEYWDEQVALDPNQKEAEDLHAMHAAAIEMPASTNEPTGIDCLRAIALLCTSVLSFLSIFCLNWPTLRRWSWAGGVARPLWPPPFAIGLAAT